MDPPFVYMKISNVLFGEWDCKTKREGSEVFSSETWRTRKKQEDRRRGKTPVAACGKK